jgi:GT2 family glycosyltransferase
MAWPMGEAKLEPLRVDFEAVIVDTGSSDGSIEGLDGRFRVLTLGDNLGFAAANNRGAEGARSQLVTGSPSTACTAI